MAESINTIKAGEDKEDEVKDLFAANPELPKRSQAEMSLEFERLRAARICENLAGQTSYLYTASRMRELAALFSTGEDTVITMPYGVYRGADAAERCFVKDLGDRDDPDHVQDVTGRMVIRDFCTPIVEVAADGKTAKCLWTVPGLEAHPDGAGNAQGYWSWCKIAMDFRLEDGTWRIWHYGQYMYFASEYEQDWSAAPSFIFAPRNNSSDSPSPVQYSYTPTAIYPDSEPEPPLPY